VEATLDGGIELRVEAYDRGLSDLRPRYFNLTSTNSPVGEMEDDRVAVLPERGKARGIELLVQKNGARVDWSASYVLAKADDQVGGRWVPREVDQRHAMNLVLTYRPKPTWSIGGSWQYHSGWPATSTVFHAERVGNSTWAVSSFGELNGVRLPSYQRLDLRATRLFQLRDQRISVYLDVFNALNRDNAAGFEYSVYFQNGQLRATEKYESLLPRIPTLGISWEF
jgi:outer membrane cobalamin receptor